MSGARVEDNPPVRVSHYNVIQRLRIWRTIQRPVIVDHYESNCVLALSTAQIIIGALLVILEIIRIFTPFTDWYFILIGAEFIITGVCGVASSRNKKRAAILVFLIFSMIATLLPIRFIYRGAIVVKAKDMDKGSAYIFGLVMLITGLLAVALAVPSSVLGFHGLCCGNKNRTPLVTSDSGRGDDENDEQEEFLVVRTLHLQPSSSPGRPGRISTEVPVDPPPPYEE